MKKFNVLTWDFNTDKLKPYNVIPYFVKQYKGRKKKTSMKSYKKMVEANPEYDKYYGLPETLDEMKCFIERESRYMFWSKCEWEMIVHGWPVKGNEYKLDVHEQVMMNIDIIASIVYDEVNKNKNKRKQKK